MTPFDPVFRYALGGIMAAMLLISVVFRRKARREKGTIPRSSESTPYVLMRLVLASLLYLPLFACVIKPEVMSWSFLDIPSWMRWAGVGLGVAALPQIYRVFNAIGPNISETVLTKDAHTLVTKGPYRRVRHPLYATSSLALLSFSLVTTSWYLAGMTVVAIAAVVWIVIPREEAHLIERFGPDYIRYRAQTGRLLPAWRKGP